MTSVDREEGIPLTMWGGAHLTKNHRGARGEPLSKENSGLPEECSALPEENILWGRSG